VLHRASNPEEEKILTAVGQALDALPVFLKQGADQAMQQLHTTTTPKRPAPRQGPPR
jgi:hypothetical protein